jgi:hypothetical protein
MSANKGEQKKPIYLGAPEIFPYPKLLFPFKTSRKQEEIKHNLQNVIFSNIILYVLLEIKCVHILFEEMGIEKHEHADSPTVTAIK